MGIREHKVKSIEDYDIYIRITSSISNKKHKLSFHLSNTIANRFASLIQFPLVPMGVLDPRSAHKRPSALPPINTSGNFPPHVSA